MDRRSISDMDSEIEHVVEKLMSGASDSELSPELIAAEDGKELAAAKAIKAFTADMKRAYIVFKEAPPKKGWEIRSRLGEFIEGGFSNEHLAADRAEALSQEHREE